MSFIPKAPFTTLSVWNALSRTTKYLEELKFGPPWTGKTGAFEKYKNNGAAKYAAEKYQQSVKGFKVWIPEGAKEGEEAIHQSRFNPEDKEPIVAVKLVLADGTVAEETHHVYANGKGTFRKGQTAQ